MSRPVIYQRPSLAEAIEFVVPFTPVLAELPATATVHVERLGVTTTYAGTIQPGATTARLTVAWVPTAAFAEVGAHRVSIEFQNALGARIARSAPLSLTIAPYTAAP